MARASKDCYGMNRLTNMQVLREIGIVRHRLTIGTVTGDELRFLQFLEFEVALRQLDIKTMAKVLNCARL